jgi:hypothetical protein
MVGDLFCAPREDVRWEAGKDLLKQVPEDPPLAITNLWAAYIKPRPQLWLFANRALYSQHPTCQAQYVFADISNSASEDTQMVRYLQEEGNWQELAVKAGYITYAKTFYLTVYEYTAA